LGGRDSIFLGNVRRVIFGAGNGIMMVAVLGLLGLHNIIAPNGVKNFLGVCINSVAVVAFSMMHLVSCPGPVNGGAASAGRLLLGAHRAALRTARSFVAPIVMIGFAITIVMLWKMR